MSDSNELGTIDLTQPFADQAAIQKFLAPAVNHTDAKSISNVLSLFLKIVETAVQKNDPTKTLRGLKIGYERAIDAGDNQYTIESNFVANRYWTSDFELEVINSKKVAFLVDVLENPEQEPEAVTEENSFLSGLAARITDELLRLYPELNQSIEFHLYIFVKKVEVAPGNQPGHIRLGSRDGVGDSGDDTIHDRPIFLPIEAVRNCPLCGGGRARGRAKTWTDPCAACP